MSEMRRGAGAEEGSALVVAIFSIFLVAAMGIALLFLADSDVKLNQAGLRAKKVFYLAEAGLEDGRKALRAANMASANKASLSDELAGVAGTNSAIQADPATIAPVYDGAGQVTGFTGYGDDVPLRSSTPFGGGRYAAFLTNDAVDGRTNKTDSNDRVMITAIGAGNDRSVEIVQAIVEIQSLPPLPATITMLGPTPSAFVGGTSASKVYSGNDCAGATGFVGIPGLAMPAVGAIGAASQDFVADNVSGATFTSGPYTGANTIDDSSSTADPRWTVLVDPLWTDCSAIAALASHVKSAADYVCTAAQPCSHWASTTDTTITYVEGDLDLGPGTRRGLLWVTGRLTLNGNSSWEGVIFVVGTGEFLRSGGGNGHTWGGVLVADIAGADNVFGTSDDCTGAADGFSGASFETTGAGNHDTVYCSDAINRATIGFPVSLRAFRER